MFENMVCLVFVCANEITLQRHVITQEGVGDDALAASEILARIARLEGRPLHADLLPIDGTIQRIEFERIMRENWQARDGIADPVVGGLQRRLTQVLLVG
jgi:hypothetical protein